MSDTVTYFEKDLKPGKILNTDGKGLWSRTAKPVLVTGLVLRQMTFDHKTFGELRVMFDTKTWDINQLGLIYTDNRFLSELNVFLEEMGLRGSVNYSEQGMQDVDYVSLDVDAKFCQSWADNFGSQQLTSLDISVE